MKYYKLILYTIFIELKQYKVYNSSENVKK